MIRSDGNALHSSVATQRLTKNFQRLCANGYRFPFSAGVIKQYLPMWTFKYSL